MENDYFLTDFPSGECPLRHLPISGSAELVSPGGPGRGLPTPLERCLCFRLIGHPSYE